MSVILIWLCMSSWESVKVLATAQQDNLYSSCSWTQKWFGPSGIRSTPPILGLVTLYLLERSFMWNLSVGVLFLLFVALPSA